MNRLVLYFHRILIISFCALLMFMLTMSTSYFFNRQQAELSKQLRSTASTLILQSAYSLGPLINSYAANSKQIPILNIMDNLVEFPWIEDASLYKINGELIAQSGDNIHTKARIDLDNKSALVAEPTIQLAEVIYSNGEPVGFIRLTLKPSSLQFQTSDTINVIHLTWVMLAIAACLGALATFALLSRMKTSKQKNRLKLQKPDGKPFQRFASLWNSKKPASIE